MADIPLPPSKNKSEDDDSGADCEKYEAIMGGYCKFYVTKTGECMIKFSLCDGFGVLKKK
ncbi:MAG: hypothetical protein H7644_02725 [Candidatus Heimdallarchaeota archaeon]|nr:hypothetical protein [Candidatus Heimdallarchaeota archaeon]MCK5142658.1 hypothetical protein [Candidatus Heimdallarchaeota archaeon]